MNETTTETSREVSDPRKEKFTDWAAKRENEIAAAMPLNREGQPVIPIGRFVRALLTTVSMNPKLLRADRRTLSDAISRCAQDGLLPDGREAALVPFDVNRKIGDQWEKVLSVVYVPMIGGYRRLVREAGIDWKLRVVHAADMFEFESGDEERILHKPSTADDPGPWTHVYAIAKERLTGEVIARDVMTRAAVLRIRDRSQGWKALRDDAARAKSVWTVWEEEMALKTVAKRQVKMLPLSTDNILYGVLAREDADDQGASVRQKIASPVSMSDKLKALVDQREEEPVEEDEDDYTDLDADGDVVDKKTGEVTKPDAEPAKASTAAAEAPSSSQAAGSTSAATNAVATDQPAPKAPDAPAATAAPADPPTQSPSAGAPPPSGMKMTPEQAKDVRKLSENLMQAMAARSVTKGTQAFLADYSYPEGSQAEAAVIALRDIHLLRVDGKASPTQCDEVRDRVTKL